MSIEESNKIPVKSDLHRNIISAYKQRLQLGRQGQSKRTEKWRENEEIMQAYVPTSENDARREDARDQGDPQYTTLQVPYSYAMILSLHTFITSIFFGRNPIFSYQGRHGEGEHSVLAMEAIVDYQITCGNNLPPLYIWLLDPLRYGVGYVGYYWDQEEIAVTKRVPKARTFLGADIPGTEKMETIQDVIRGYEGTKIYNCRPQDFMTDPRVPVLRFHEGEFCMRYDKLAYHTALKRERQGMYFNLKEAITQAPRHTDREDGSHTKELPLDFEDVAIDLSNPTGKPNFLNIREFYWDIIPKDVGVGTGTRPEKWVFTIAEEQIVIGAQPLGLLSNKYPFEALEFEVDGYGLFNRSALEIAQSLNQTLTWLFNSHFFNVRKTLNDQFFVDPSMITMTDLETPTPGRIVRLKPAAYGKPVDSFVKQFPVTDVTRQNMSDSNTVVELMQNLLGANDATLGSLTPSRATATEVRSANQSAQSRIKTTAEWWSATGYTSLSKSLVQMSQQLFQEERQFRVVGDLAQYGNKYINVTPEDIAGFYDFIPVDGTAPMDRFAQANLWQQLFQGIGQFPQITQQYDLAKIFGYVAQLAGLKNISQFRVEVVPDQTAVDNLRAGNVTSISEGNPVEPGQVPGVGATG